jgi:hypothetical protein
VGRILGEERVLDFHSPLRSRLQMHVLAAQEQRAHDIELRAFDTLET